MIANENRYACLDHSQMQCDKAILQRNIQDTPCLNFKHFNRFQLINIHHFGKLLRQKKMWDGGNRLRDVGEE